MLPKCLVLVGAALLLACTARTSVTSFVDPAYRQSQAFSSVAVFALGVGLDERQIIEGTVTQRLTEHGVRALRGIDLVPPTRQLTTEEWTREVAASGAETVLMITKTGEGASHAYVPQTSFGTAQTYGNTTYLNFNTTGGHTVSKPRAAYDAVLFDVRSDRPMWKADARSARQRLCRFQRSRPVSGRRDR